MKRVISVLLVLCMLFSLAACTGSGPRVTIIEKAVTEEQYEEVLEEIEQNNENNGNNGGEHTAASLFISFKSREKIFCGKSMV